MSEHSPAPWIFIEDENYSRTITDSCGDTIMQEAKLYHLQRTPAKLADWKLIAAAPDTAAERDRLREVNAELLAALRAMLSVCGCGTALDCSVCNSARAAIAKAEGKS